MHYAIDLTQVAIRNLGELLMPVRRYTLAQLENLSSDPALLSEQNEFIYPFDARSVFLIMTICKTIGAWAFCLIIRKTSDG
jgi:hypothetical protein